MIADTNGIPVHNPKDLPITSKADGSITAKHHVKGLIVGLTEIDFIRRVQNLYKKTETVPVFGACRPRKHIGERPRQQRRKTAFGARIGSQFNV